jgi:uncharacterized protein (TIGR02246 family)
VIAALTASCAIAVLALRVGDDSATGDTAMPDGGDTMAAHRPEDWPRVFEQQLNAGDLDGVMALYAPDARFVPRSGDTIEGRDGIRPVVDELIRAKTRFRSRVRKVIVVGDVAVLYTDFEGTRLDASGQTVEVRSAAMEVLRRRPDGTWVLIVGDPNARA